MKHAGRFDRIVAAGDCRPLMRRALVKRGIAPERILSLRQISALSALEGDAVVFAVGNIVGSGLVGTQTDHNAGSPDVR